MRYLIFAYDSLDEAIAKLFIKEISRFDIRAEIVLTKKSNEIKQNLERGSTDVLIEVTSKNDNSFSKLVRKAGVKRCLLYQSIKRKGSNHTFKSIDLLIGDIPTLPQPIVYLGNCVFDLVKSHRDLPVDNLGEMKPQIAVVSGFGPPGNRVSQIVDIGKGVDGCFIKADLENDFQTAIRIIQKSNAAIVATNVAELVALYLNCPAIRINRSGLFADNQFSILGHLTGNEVIPIYGHRRKWNISEDLSRILRDHNYCAGILQDYQAAKEILGNEPATRKTAKYIVDWLEEN